MDHIERKLEIKELSEKGAFQGLLATYGVDQGMDRIIRGAFTKTLAERKSTGRPLPLLWAHDRHQPIGTLEIVSDTAKGLEVKGQLLLDVRRAVETYALLKAKIVSGLSIGFQVVKEKMEGSVRLLKEINLMEGSLVLFPMADDARVSVVKSEDEDLDGVLESVRGWRKSIGN